jgi:hypothetical protein
MAKLKSKGTALHQLTGSTIYTAVAQIISLNGPDMESETFDADTLDNADAGIPYLPTGRSEGGSVGGELFYDPALSGHQDLLALITTPATESWKLVYVDTEEWSFDGAGFGFSGPTVALGDGVKAGFSMKVDGLPTFPT